MNPRLLAAISMLACLQGARAATFSFPGHNLTVPDGFTVELAVPPDLAPRPISVAMDEQGRLYVTDSSGSSERADKQIQNKNHRILRLEDTDGDGKFDKSTVFADHMMFPEGALWLDGSLYCSAPPEIWKLTDTNGDGVADKREVWHDGKTLTGCANDLHGPYAGRDGRIYWCKGAFAEQKYTLPNGKPFVTRVSHIFRAKVDGTGLEPVLTGGMDNPVGVAFLSTGERILSCTFFQFPAGGKRDGLIHAIYGGVYGKTQEGIYEHKMTGDVMPVLDHMGAAAPCGIIAASGTLFGRGYSDNLFACYFNLHKVVRHELQPDGATFKTKDTDFLTSDNQDFHPTDVFEDADGSLLVVDTGGWYKVCCPTSQLAKPDILGAVYRIRRKAVTKYVDPRGQQIPWQLLNLAELCTLLNDPRLFVQQRTLRELARQGKEAVPALADSIRKTPSEIVHLNAIWALTRIDHPSAREAVRTLFRDPNAGVRQAAFHSASLWRDKEAVDGLIASLKLPDQGNRRAAAEALGRIGDARAVPALLDAADALDSPSGKASADATRILEHSVCYAMIEIGNVAAVRAGLDRSGSRARRVALTALDQMEGGELSPDVVIPLQNSKDPLLKQTASWIVSHRPEWGDRLAARFERELYQDKLPDPAELQLQLTQLARSPAIQSMMAGLAGEITVPVESRLLVLRAMASAGLKDTPEKWFEVAIHLLGTDNKVLAAQAVTTARTFVIPKAGAPALQKILQDVGGDVSYPADVRLEALSAAGNLGGVSPELYEFIQANLAGSQPMLVRGAAASILARARLSPSQQLALADTMKSVGPLEAPKLLPAFERGANEALGLKLVESLKESSGLRGLRVDLLKPLFARYPASVQAAGESLLTTLNADVAKQAAYLDSLVGEVKNGDIRRGQEIFRSQKAACSTCHAMGYLGGHLGPDLTKVGAARNERDLLEAIVFPSATFVRSYEPFTVAVKGGEDYSGIVKKDAPDEVILATGPETEQHIPRASIVEMRPGAVSLMPQGLDQVLNHQELADLIAFLKASK